MRFYRNARLPRGSWGRPLHFREMRPIMIRFMKPAYTHKNVADVPDSAPAFGLGERQESRFASDHFDAEQTGFSHHMFKPGQRQSFGHRHHQAEEVYFVVSGSGRMKLDDRIVELKPRDVIRVAPGVTRAFEAGDDALEILAFGPRARSDRGEIIDDWWTGE